MNAALNYHAERYRHPDVRFALTCGHLLLGMRYQSPNSALLAARNEALTIGPAIFEIWDVSARDTPVAYYWRVM